jgi:hypothetical protein
VTEGVCSRAEWRHDCAPLLCSLSMQFYFFGEADLDLLLTTVRVEDLSNIMRM